VAAGGDPRGAAWHRVSVGIAVLDRSVRQAWLGELVLASSATPESGALRRTSRPPSCAESELGGRLFLAPAYPSPPHLGWVCPRAARRTGNTCVSPRAGGSTVDAIAARYGRAPSTIRGWCEAGRFPGAYKLHDREWRIPAAALEAFETKESRRERPAGGRGRGAQSLSDWRHAS
jgi:hypothetical protein